MRFVHLFWEKIELAGFELAIAMSDVTAQGFYKKCGFVVGSAVPSGLVPKLTGKYSGAVLMSRKVVRRDFARAASSALVASLEIGAEVQAPGGKRAKLIAKSTELSWLRTAKGWAHVSFFERF